MKALNIPRHAASRTELFALGFSRNVVAREFDQVTKSLLLHKSLRDPGTELQQRFTNFRNTPNLLHSMEQRIRCYHVENSGVVFSGWAALSLRGLKYWVDAAPVTVITGHRRDLRYKFMPVIREDATPQSISTSTYAPRVRMADWATALVSALSDVLRGRITWSVAPLQYFHPSHLRAIQVIDAVRALPAVCWDEAAVMRAAKGRINARRLKKLIALSADGADSPPETSLRLLLQHAPELRGIEWEAQVPIMNDGSLASPKEAKLYLINKLTVPDQLCRELRIAIYYDGSGHREQDVYERDAEIMAKLSTLGWKYIRITRKMMRNPEAVVEAIHAMAQ